MLKFIFFCIVKVLTLPLLIFPFYETSIFLSIIPFQFGNWIRYFYYKSTLKSVGNNVLFSFGIILSHKDISIGNNVRFGPFCSIGLVDFGNDVLVAQSVHFLSGSQQHRTKLNSIPMRMQTGVIKKVTIGSDIWIGTQSVVMSNIPDGCVIGAGSIVVKNLEKINSIYAGNPARYIRERTG